MNSTYRPRGNSLAARVCNWFIANPEETLGLADVAVKWHEPQSVVKHQLAGAVEGGWLACSSNWVYQAGAQLPVDRAESPAAPAPAARSTPLPSLASPLERAASATIDPLSVPLEDGIPLEITRGRAPVDWSLLFQRMAPGQSCVLPKAKRAMVSKAMAAAHKSGAVKFALKMQPDKQSFRLWRLE